MICSIYLPLVFRGVVPPFVAVALKSTTVLLHMLVAEAVIVIAGVTTGETVIIILLLVTKGVPEQEIAALSTQVMLSPFFNVLSA